MIGNDIVDLALAARQSNWERKNFLQRIFVADEIALIRQSVNPEIIVWELWSRKEAAYKIYNRATGNRGFYPLRLICEAVSNTDGINYGEVRIDGLVYLTQTVSSADCIHTVAAAKLEILNTILIVCDPFEGFEVLKDAKGLPYSVNPVNGKINPVSVSHHGRFYSKIITSL